MYAYESNNAYLKVLSYIQLRPSGNGRPSLIHLVAKNKLHQKDGGSKSAFIKICTDYAKIKLKENLAVEDACCILEYFIDEHMLEVDSDRAYKLGDKINELLVPIYQMSPDTNEWIKEFWNRLESDYKSDNQNKSRLAKDIISDTIGFKHTKLAEYLPMELCAIAEMFWGYSPEENYNNNWSYMRGRREIPHQYGLSENAEHYEYGSIRSTAINSNFFYILFQENPYAGLAWAVDFVNKAVSHFAEEYEDCVFSYELNFVDRGISRCYLGQPNMWVATIDEHRMPMVISDLLYCLKEVLRSTIENDAVVNKATDTFAKNISNYIYEKSNNIALLSIIADIGMAFPMKLPGYALDLATNISIIRIDLSRYSLLNKNPTLELLEKQMAMTIGIPLEALPDRYNKKQAQPYNLRDYFINSQIYCDTVTKGKCHNILDCLYSITPNDKANATDYLQIQKMDLRTAHIVEVGNNLVALVPTITGEAKEIVIETEKHRQPENLIASLINKCNEKINNNEFELKDYIATIEALLKIRNTHTEERACEKPLIDLVAVALNNDDLDSCTREKFCKIWIDGVRTFFSNGSFIFEHSRSSILFAQVETSMCEDVKNEIKQLIVDLILFEGNHGIISELARIAKRYLEINRQLAKAVFNTIVELAADEMSCQKFNAEHIGKSVKGDREYTYQSKKEEIMGKYLFNDAELNLLDFDVNTYDMTTFCYAINCGIPLTDSNFADIVKTFLVAMIDMWKSSEKTHNSHDLLDVYSLSEVMMIFQRELVASSVQTDIVLDILFTGIDFASFTDETISFYLDIFGSLLVEYFDSHRSKQKRANYEKIIRSLECKVIAIEAEDVKMELYKAVTLSVTRYGGSGDWSQCSAEYSYQDKQFLNELFSKYGGYHLKEMLDTIHKLHLGKLLPEILLSIRDAFKDALSTDASRLRRQTFEKIASKREVTILTIITTAFLDFGDQIKQDEDLTKAFEEILQILVGISSEEAATILDEFRVH